MVRHLLNSIQAVVSIVRHLLNLIDASDSIARQLLNSIEASGSIAATKQKISKLYLRDPCKQEKNQ